MSGWSAWIALSFLGCVAGTWLARRYALGRNLLDQPGQRRNHEVATPRGGGVAIVAVLLAASAWMAMAWPGQRLQLAGFASGLALVAGIGWWDDHRPLSPWLRLAVHVVAGSFLAGFVFMQSGSWLGALVAWGLIVSMTNIWNFMDGINGLAASQAVLCMIPLAAILAGPWQWVCVAAMAAILGFLPFNFPRARIFLGDVGSGALGFVLAWLLVAAFAAAESPWPLLMPFAAFLVDAGLTLLSRVLNGERWWTPHSQHLYQQLLHCAYGHAGVTSAYGIFTIIAVGLCWFSMPSAWSGVWAITWFVFTSLVWWVMRNGCAKHMRQQ